MVAMYLMADRMVMIVMCSSDDGSAKTVVHSGVSVCVLLLLLMMQVRAGNSCPLPSLVGFVYSYLILFHVLQPCPSIKTVCIR